MGCRIAGTNESTELWQQSLHDCIFIHSSRSHYAKKPFSLASTNGRFGEAGQIVATWTLFLATLIDASFETTLTDHLTTPNVIKYFAACFEILSFLTMTMIGVAMKKIRTVTKVRMMWKSLALVRPVSTTAEMHIRMKLKTIKTERSPDFWMTLPLFATC